MQPASGQPAAPNPVRPSSRPPGKAVGRARVTASGGFPTGLVVTIVAVVLALGVAAFLVVPKLHRTNAATPPPATLAPASPSAPVSPPAPRAFSDNTARGTDPASVLDNLVETFWASTPQTTPEATDAWIAIDMGTVANRTGLIVTPRPRLLGFPSAFRIESSDDAVTWTTVPGQDFGPNNPFQATPDGPETFTFATPVAARYIRFFATDLGLPPQGALTNGESARFFALEIADMHVLS